MSTNKRKEAAALFELIGKSTLKVPKNAGALKIPNWWSSKSNPPASPQTPSSPAIGAPGSLVSRTNESSKPRPIPQSRITPPPASAPTPSPAQTPAVPAIAPRSTEQDPPPTPSTASSSRPSGSRANPPPPPASAPQPAHYPILSLGRAPPSPAATWPPYSGGNTSHLFHPKATPNPARPPPFEDLPARARGRKPAPAAPSPPTPTPKAASFGPLNAAAPLPGCPLGSSFPHPPLYLSSLSCQKWSDWSIWLIFKA